MTELLSPVKEIKTIGKRFCNVKKSIKTAKALHGNKIKLLDKQSN